MYTPENQYRCTIIRGKSQTEMEDLLPVYANIVHKYCPCTEETFRKSSELSQEMESIYRRISIHLNIHGISNKLLNINDIRNTCIQKT